MLAYVVWEGHMCYKWKPIFKKNIKHVTKYVSHKIYIEFVNLNSAHAQCNFYCRISITNTTYFSFVFINV